MNITKRAFFAVTLIFSFGSSFDLQAQWIPVWDDLKVLGDDIVGKAKAIPKDLKTLGERVSFCRF